MVEFERKKPLGIVVCMVLFGFLGFVGTFASLAMLGSLLGNGPFRVNGELVDKAEFAAFLLPFMSFYLPCCLLAAAIAWSIRTEHPRSRPLLMLYSCGLLAMPFLFLSLGVPASDALSVLVPGVIVPGIAWLYLYRKDSVVQYYAAIQLDREAFPEADST